MVAFHFLIATKHYCNKLGKGACIIIIKDTIYTLRVRHRDTAHFFLITFHAGFY